MFLQLFEITKFNFTSPARRKSYYFYNTFNTHWKFKHLSTKLKWKAGRNDSGRIIIRTKGSLKIKNKTIQINYSFRYLKLGFIASFTLIPFKNRIVSLIYFSSGAATYYLASDDNKLFSFFLYNNQWKLKRFKITKLYLMLFQIKKLSFVSCLDQITKQFHQYSRSPGTKSKILHFDKINHLVLIQLPSGIKKTFSYYSFALLGRVANPLHSKCSNLKSGYWRSFGVKSIVRGVAMNPVDHPHGGRTKAIKHQRTPWGKTTKIK